MEITPKINGKYLYKGVAVICLGPQDTKGFVFLREANRLNTFFGGRIKDLRRYPVPVKH